MAAIVVEVPCSGSVHRLELHDDGTVEMLDHDEAVVRAFVAFNAEPPECLEALDEVREDPVDFILDHADMADEVRGLLACDFAEHVLHIFEAKFPDDDRPRKAIQVTRAYLRGKATVEQLDEAKTAALAAWSAADADWAAADMAERKSRLRRGAAAERAELVECWAYAAARAATAAEAVARLAARSADSMWAVARAAAGAANAAARAATLAAAWAEEAADEAAGVAAWKVAKEAERRWQLGRIIKVLDALERGKRWPRLS